MRRVLAVIVILWALGFAWFASTLPQPVEGDHTDAIVVPTGGNGRIQRGLELLAEHKADAMLVTGVDPEVKPGEFAAEFEVPEATMECCIVLDFEAVDTRSNASETAIWVEENGYSSLRLVTTDWHMRRAANELAASLPPDVSVMRDAVASHPSFSVLFLEYHKLLASIAIRMWPL